MSSKVYTKAIMTFGVTEREDRVKYKGQWGRLYAQERTGQIKQVLGSVDKYSWLEFGSGS